MCVKVFALGAAALFILYLVLGWDTVVPPVLLVAAVVLVLATAVVDAIAVAVAKSRDR
ncbi:hypothetical protein [Saccharothrix hoggarensis]|uniref:Uncharacterized protein n=1 Tax=Saccharothrix hoggarensis TaxID=913853 RepID=A0ABW3QYA0_9PSEU